MMSLQQSFLQLVTPYSTTIHAQKLWAELAIAYTTQERHYHTLTHLKNLLDQLLQVKTEIADWNTILFTLFYHDIIYNPLKNDNEDQSAQLAVQRMRELNLPPSTIEKCRGQILATIGHQVAIDQDTNYFTDADLSILGAERELYLQYTKNVRKEYNDYPDLVYNAGRAKVLKHFLAMEKIYKTEYFHQRFEVNAKLNLERELELYQ